jgi:hypothetical protein
MHLAFGHATPLFWGEVVAVQLGRIEQSQNELASILDAAVHRGEPIPQVDGYDARLTYPARWVHDALYLVIAIRHIFILAEKCNGVLRSSDVGKALRKFRQSVPEPVMFRNFVEHIEQYVDGKGKVQLLDYDAAGGFVVDLETDDYRGDLSLRFGGHTLHRIKASSHAAMSLAQVCDEIAFSSLSRT